MAQTVTIEGSVTPSSELPRGQRTTVAYTDRIKRLVDRGYVVIVDGPHDDDGAQVAEGTGEPNVGTEVPADGQPHDLVSDGPANPDAAQVEQLPEGQVAAADAAQHALS